MLEAPRLRSRSLVRDRTGYTEILRLAWVDVVNTVVWLVAFAFIEMNFFEWQREMLDARDSGAAAQNPA